MDRFHVRSVYGQFQALFNGIWGFLQQTQPIWKKNLHKHETIKLPVPP